MPVLSRRAAFAVPGAAMVLAAASPPHPDAALLAACERYRAAAAKEYQLLAIYRAASDSPEEKAALAAWDAAGDVSYDALDCVIALPALTLEGAAAKGRCVWTYWEMLAQPEAEMTFGEVAAWSVLKDLARLRVGMA
ncbi:hypothetical protein [Roseomonas chloroacetimidivorans]|uniref:hypothetical protein n=1 Tax=Roseomonas chloroacetimidivorans TaxID=1766656 RepID=UPI003C7793FA